jgi:hypothetical protein
MSEWYRKGWRALFVLLVVVAATAHAQGQPQTGAVAPVATAPTDDLYAAVVPVTEQSNAELKRGAGLGLREVLVRVAGHGDVVRSAALSDALADAGRYLDQYRYERNPNTEPGAAPLLLQLRFAPNSVTQLLRGAGLPVWSGSRPALQAWLAIEENGRRQLVDERSPLAPALRAHAWRRGLALHFPADTRALPVDEVWQVDAVRARAAALAGAGEVVAVGRIAPLPGGRCSGLWALASGAQPAQQGDGETLDACLAAGVDRLADTLARQYASAAAGGGGDALLRVSGVDNFNAYAALLVYLKQVGAIKSANPVEVQGDTVLLRVQLEGGAEQLTRQFALDNRLQAATDASATPPTTADPAAAGSGAAAQPVLHYRWLAGPG